MANISVTQSCYWGGPEYSWAGLVYGNSVTVSNGATLTVDPSVYAPTNFDLGVTLVATSGFATINIVNNSTTTPLLHYGPTSGRLQLKAGCILNITGNYIQIGTGNGQANQVLDTAWTGAGFGLADEPAVIEIETGNGTGIYETWLNITQAGSLQNIGINSLGKWFLYNTTTGSITFGDYGATATGKGGNIVPSGARIRVYNIGIGTKNSSGVKTINSTSSNDYGCDSNNGGNYMNFDKCYFFGFVLALNNNVPTISNIGCVRSLSVVFCVKPYLEYVNVCPDKYTVSASYALKVESSTFVTIKNSKLALIYNATQSYPATFNTGYNNAELHTYDNECWLINRTGSSYASSGGTGGINFSHNNDKLIGGGFYTSAPTLTINNMKYSDSPHGSQVGGSYSSMVQAYNIYGPTINGFEMIADGSYTNASFISQGVSKVVNANIKVNNNYAIDLQVNQPFTLARSTIAGIANSIVQFKGNSQRIIMQNVKTYPRYIGYLNASALLASNSIFKGVDVNPALANIVNEPGNYVNTHFYELFQSATLGFMGLFFTPKTDDNNNYEASGIKFDKSGKMYITANGGYIIFTWPHWVIGQTGFPSNGTLTLGGSGYNTFTYQFDIDTGNGFSGNFQTFNHANLSAYNASIDPTVGFRLKVKVSAATGSISNYINKMYWTTYAAGNDSDTYLYPLDTYNLTIGPVDPDTEIRIMASGTTNELGGIEQVGSTGYYTWTYDYSGADFEIDINILSEAYENEFYKNILLSSADKSIIVKQRADRWYKNP